MALLRRTLQLIDAQGVSAYLESTNLPNDQRYATEGFEPVGMFEYPGGGPAVTTMWRAAGHEAGRRCRCDLCPCFLAGAASTC